MDFEQRKFYDYLAERLKAGKYPAVDGNVSYVFTYIYTLINHWQDKGFEAVFDALLDIAEGYHYETKLAELCKFWAYDCLIGLGEDKKFLQFSEPESIFKRWTLVANERCNAYERLGAQASGIDVFWVTGVKVIQLAKKSETRFRDVLTELLDDDAKRNGPWLPRLRSAETYEHYYFSGTPIWPKPVKNCFVFNTNDRGVAEVQQVARMAENILRKEHGLPEIGEGWVSETELYQYLKLNFPETQVIQHGRPSWLGRQHFDIWFPRWNIAVEYHGDQHFRAIDFFGGQEGLNNSKERDARKTKLCEENGVRLLIALPGMKHDETVNKIKQIHPGLDRGN